MEARSSKDRDGRPRSLWAEFLFSRVLVFVVSRTAYGDIPGYLESVSRFLTKGTPYGEEGFGYPVLAFLFVSIPSFFGLTKLDQYYPFFRAQCFVIDLILFYLLSRRCARGSLLVYILCTAVLANVLYHRLDILLGLMVVGALVLEARGSWRLAGITLGAAIAFKIIPVFLLPAWMAWRLRRSVREAFGVVGFVVLGCGLPVLVGWLLWGRDSILFMGSHAGRGVQIESMWASIQMVLMEFGLPGETNYKTGSYNLTTPLEGVFTTASLGLAAAASLWGGVTAARLALRRGPFVVAVSSTLGALILASKVFSPQYLLFFLPVLAWSFDSMGQRFRWWAMALTLAWSGLTTWVYPYHEQALVALSPVATVPLIGRNVLFAALVVLLQVHAWRCGRTEATKEGLATCMVAAPGAGGVPS